MSELTKLAQLAEQHSLNYASPHYFVLSVAGLRSIIEAALRSMPAEPVAWYDVEDGQIISAPRWYSDGGRTEAPLYATHVPEANFGNTPPTAPVPPDWSEVGRLLDAVSAASAGRYMVGTTNWAAFICRQMKQATPPTAPVLTESWQPIETAPRDGSVFVAARFVEGETPDPDFDCELGRYKPLVFDRYEEAGDNLFRKVPEQVYDWHGFNNFGRMTHWMPLPPAAVIGRAGGGA